MWLENAQSFVPMYKGTKVVHGHLCILMGMCGPLHESCMDRCLTPSPGWVSSLCLTVSGSHLGGLLPREGRKIWTYPSQSSDSHCIDEKTGPVSMEDHEDWPPMQSWKMGGVGAGQILVPGACHRAQPSTAEKGHQCPLETRQMSCK